MDEYVFAFSSKRGEVSQGAPELPPAAAGLYAHRNPRTLKCQYQMLGFGASLARSSAKSTGLHDPFCDQPIKPIDDHEQPEEHNDRCGCIKNSPRLRY